MPKQSPYATFSGTASRSYVTTHQTAAIVNIAIRLGRPLLVEGEAGCGKTRLASAVAEELGLEDRFISMTVKSTSQAKDLLYRFDALRRLQDAQDPKNDNARFVYPYIELEPLGQAVRQGEPCVVLIDEIDKADIDFPNDLLDVLDRFEFDIEDLPQSESESCEKQRGFGRRISAPKGGVQPIVIITSNREKQLPQPFLRRCIYIQLEFPNDPSTLARIVRMNLHARLETLDDQVIAHAVHRFCDIRERGKLMQKLPATSELVDWVRVLHWQERNMVDLSADKLDTVDEAVLFKVRQDIELYRAGTMDESGR